MWRGRVDPLADSNGETHIKTLFHNMEVSGLQCNPLLWYNSGVQRDTSDMSKREKILAEIARLKRELQLVQNSISDIVEKGVASVTVSTGDGSKSCTNLGLDILQSREKMLKKQIGVWQRKLEGKSAVKIVHRMTTHY